MPVIVVTAKDLTKEDRKRLNGQAIQILQKGGYSARNWSTKSAPRWNDNDAIGHRN